MSRTFDFMVYQREGALLIQEPSLGEEVSGNPLVEKIYSLKGAAHPVYLLVGYGSFSSTQQYADIRTLGIEGDSFVLAPVSFHLKDGEQKGYTLNVSYADDNPNMNQEVFEKYFFKYYPASNTLQVPDFKNAPDRLPQWNGKRLLLQYSDGAFEEVRYVKNQNTESFGRSLEGLRKFTSHNELKQFFGPENVEQETSPFGEYYSILYPHAEHPVRLKWKTAAFAQLAAIEVYTEHAVDEASAAMPPWQTKEGIKIGMTLKELEQLNGKPILFRSFHLQSENDETTGTILSFHGGKLERAPVHIIVAPQDAQTYQRKFSLNPPKTFNSTQSAVQELGCFVSTLVVK